MIDTFSRSATLGLPINNTQKEPYMSQAFPLHWPAGWPRTPKHQIQDSRFDCSWQSAIDGLFKELHLLDARNIVISTDTELRKDGLPYANQRVNDQGVAVYFVLKGETQCFPCDRWATQKENIRAIAKTIEAIRGIERWGSGQMMKQTLNAFKALPAPGGQNKRPWWEVLGTYMHAPISQIEMAYMKQARIYHPDNQETGNHEKMAELNEAIEQARRNLQ